MGDPDKAHVSTSYVERSNLSIRMATRRFTRLTNAFSKKLENLEHSVSLYFMYYNFCRPHRTLKGVMAMVKWRLAIALVVAPYFIAQTTGIDAATDLITAANAPTTAQDGADAPKGG